MKTWQKEALVVGALLGGTTLLTGSSPIAWVTTLAVFITFCYAQVGARLAEAEAARTGPKQDVRTTLEKNVRSLSQRYEHAADKPQLDDVVAAEEQLAHHVYCHRWLTRYLVAKELCWMLLFVMLAAWPALVGVFIFLLYPVWRRWRSVRKERSTPTINAH